MTGFAVRLILGIALALAGGAAAQDKEPQVIRVMRLERAPVLDGDLGEWGTVGWQKVPLAPAVKSADRAKLGLSPQERNPPVELDVELKVGVAGGRIYFAARWPDDAADTDYRLWELRGGRYVEGSQRDDAFAVRFPMEGEFDRSMLSGKTYAVDVWLWTAGRSNRAGFAEDMTHRISTRMTEKAAEYEVKGVGTVYIRKLRDAGTPVYRNLRPPAQPAGERVVSIELNDKPDGSVADVAAKGRWSKNAWSLELARKLDTGNADDVVFRAGQKMLFQIAVFNRNADENKSVSEPLLLDLGALR